MTDLGYIWGILILFSVTSFTIISVIIIINGYGEIKDIFKKLGKKAETN
jgi:hypothetical protein